MARPSAARGTNPENTMTIVSRTPDNPKDHTKCPRIQSCQASVTRMPIGNSAVAIPAIKAITEMAIR